jgi:putative DNA primase/helicase
MRLWRVVPNPPVTLPHLGRHASEIPEEPIDFLILGYIARKKVQDIFGDPGVGKSTLIADLAAGLSRGRGFFGCAGTEPVNSILVGAEYDDSDTIVPRLRAAGADLKRVLVIGSSFKTKAGVTPLTLPTHLAMLEQAIADHRSAAIFIDPIAAFLSEKIDSHVEASLRRVLAELAALAQRTMTAIIYLRHLNKQPGSDRALYRCIGSIAFAAAARASFLVGFDPTDIAPESERRRVVA